MDAAFLLCGRRSPVAIRRSSRESEDVPRDEGLHPGGARSAVAVSSSARRIPGRSKFADVLLEARLKVFETSNLIDAEESGLIVIRFHRSADELHQAFTAAVTLDQ